MQPIAHMGWYEWSKLEEESGDLKEALEILKRGLAACTINETLLTKVIKLHERLHRYDEVREMLGKLKHEPTEKVWKSMLRVENIVKLEKKWFDFGNLSKQYSEILIKNLNRRYACNSTPSFDFSFFFMSGKIANI